VPDSPLLPDNIRGDALKNFEVSLCRLSFYEAESEDDLLMTVLYFAAKRRSFDHVHYCEIDSAEINNCFEIDRSVPGETDSEDVNRRHFDIAGLNLAKSSSLVERCVRDGVVRTIPAKQIKKGVVELVSKGSLMLDRLSPGLRIDVEKEISS
jgi:hypothetical protein